MSAADALHSPRTAPLKDFHKQKRPNMAAFACGNRGFGGRGWGQRPNIVIHWSFDEGVKTWFCSTMAAIVELDGGE